jgi:hypothetical protein
MMTAIYNRRESSFANTAKTIFTFSSPPNEHYEGAYETKPTYCFRLSKLWQFCDPQGERKLDWEV